MQDAREWNRRRFHHRLAGRLRHQGAALRLQGLRPKEHEAGIHDVLLNNTDCFVVPPGVVRAIMKKLTAVAHYKREGGFYLANLTLSSFGRQGRGE